MAKIEDLIKQVADPALQDDLAREVKGIKEAKRFGLVFEEHIPETVSLYDLPIRPGTIVQNRTTPDDLTEYQVQEVNDERARMVAKGTNEPIIEIRVADLLVVKPFHEPIYPGLSSQIPPIKNGPIDKPTHIVINGENYHVLQSLIYSFNKKIDCVYIDPPYNTGDKSWKYNNKFVDNNDRYKHSKWLSYMEKRLNLCKWLLKPDGVIIVTIDEHEVHRLGVLVKQIFPNARHQMVTIVMGGGTTPKKSFRRVEEYALFIYFGEASPVELPYDLLSDKELKTKVSSEFWVPLVGRSGESQPSDRPTLVYPIIINEQHIVNVGRTLQERIDSGEVMKNSDILNSFTPPPLNKTHYDLSGLPRKMVQFGLGVLVQIPFCRI